MSVPVGSCRDDFTVFYGEFASVIWWVNCTDSACQDCAPAVVTPVSTCRPVPPLGHVLITSVAECSTANVEQYYDREACSGDHDEWAVALGACDYGTIVQAANARH